MPGEGSGYPRGLPNFRLTGLLGVWDRPVILITRMSACRIDALLTLIYNTRFRVPHVLWCHICIIRTRISIAHF